MNDTVDIQTSSSEMITETGLSPRGQFNDVVKQLFGHRDQMEEIRKEV